MYEVVEALRRIYCSTTGYDYAHVFVPEERRWLRHAAESGRFRAPADPIDPRRAARSADAGRGLRAVPASHASPARRASRSKALDMLVPILDEVIAEAAEAGIRNILIGMAHRGRLNVMAHVLNKPYAQILAEFKDPVSSKSFREDMAWTGDVKYHAGAHRAIKGGDAMDLVVSMPPNPSHLEAVDPVVEGMARAAGTIGRRSRARRRSIRRRSAADPDPRRRGVPRPGRRRRDAEPDAGCAGYNTGGTIHIIANNQLGFTTGAEDAYSTSYASGLARGFKIPIVHVNADDPEACVEAARLAIAYRDEVPARLPDRPDRLPPLRPQRRRRAGVHAAADVPEDRARIRRCASSGRTRSSSAASIERGAGRRADQQKHIGELQAGAGRAAAGAGLRRAAAGGAAAGRRRQGRDRRCRSSGCAS